MIHDELGCRVRPPDLTPPDTHRDIIALSGLEVVAAAVKKRDNFYVLRHYPESYLEGLTEAAARFCWPSTDYWYVRRNVDKARPLVELYNVVLYGRIPTPVFRLLSDLPTDGRSRRSERSRTAIVQAMLELIGKGALSPTAQQVAERADVGVRTVFRHFSDMETLFATMNDQLTAEVDSLFVDTVQTGPYEDRVDALIERRMTIFGTLAPYVRSSTLQRWRSAFLQREHERTTRLLRRDLRGSSGAARVRRDLLTGGLSPDEDSLLLPPPPRRDDLGGATGTHQ